MKKLLLIILLLPSLVYAQNNPMGGGSIYNRGGSSGGGGGPTTNPVSTAQGGTGAALTPTIGDIPYAGSSTTFSLLSDVAIGQFLLSGGAGVAPVYSGTGVTLLTPTTAPNLILVGTATNSAKTTYSGNASANKWEVGGDSGNNFYVRDVGAGTNIISSSNGSGTLNVRALVWNNGSDLSEYLAPRFKIDAIDQPSVLADTGVLFGSFTTTVTVTLRSASLFVESAAATCTTKPVYNLNQSATYNSSPTVISTGCTPTSATALGTNACSMSATSVSANAFVWWSVTTPASACAAKIKLQYEYTVN